MEKINVDYKWRITNDEKFGLNISRWENRDVAPLSVMYSKKKTLNC